MDKSNIARLIFSGQLYSAAQILYSQINDSDHPLAWELDNIMISYRNMAKYLSQGVEDDKSKEVLKGFKIRMLMIHDYLQRDQNKKNSTLQYYTTMRIVDSQRASDTIFEYDQKDGPQILEEENRRIYDNMIASLFDRVWVSNNISEGLIQKIASSSEYLRKVMVSAMTLGLAHFWDMGKIRFLFQQYTLTDISISYRIRLFFAILFVFYKDSDYCSLYEDELKILLHLANETYPFDDLFPSMADMILQSLDTERVSDILRKETPNIINAGKEFLQKASTFSDEIEDLDFSDEKINDFEETLEVIGKLEEKGADTVYFSFENTKQYPFFDHISSWFLPFDKSHSAIKEAYEKNPILKKTLSIVSSNLCDSDLYSSVFTFQVKSQFFNFDVSLASSTNSYSEDDITPPEKKVDIEIKHYIQNLYRYIMLYPNVAKNEKEILEILPRKSSTLLNSVVATDSVNNKSASFFMERGEYTKAILLLVDLNRKNGGNSTTILAKLGYCYYKVEEYYEAINLLEKSDLIEDLSSQLKLILARCYVNIYNYEKALAIYEQFKSNEAILLSIAKLLIKRARYTEAIPLLHEYVYRSQTPEKAYKPLVWCYLTTHNYSKSEEYFQKIKTLDKNDYLNGLYIYLVKRDSKKAFELAKEVVQTGKIQDLIVDICNDLIKIADSKISKDECVLLLDTAYMSLKEKENNSSENL